MSQLADINEKALKKVEVSREILNETIRKTIANLPEEKERILDLKKIWEITIQKKCTLKIFESLHRDAEIAARCSCLVGEYKDKNDFFEKLNY